MCATDYPNVCIAVLSVCCKNHFRSCCWNSIMGLFKVAIKGKLNDYIFKIYIPSYSVFNIPLCTYDAYNL